MKPLQFKGDLGKIYAGLEILAPDLAYQITQSDNQVTFIETTHPFKIEKQQQAATIYFSKPVQAFRGLTILLTHWQQTCFSYQEEPTFETIGPFLDTSRNAVPTVKKIKYLLRQSARLGLNTFTLYMEDTYEVPTQEYFGYLRGRYTQSELKFLDDYAFRLGIELIPAIQTLGHLKNLLKWPVYHDIRDTEDILLVNHPKTYALLQEMITAVMTPFRTKKIHLGMDEAPALGSGNSLALHGYQERYRLMEQHLSQLIAITKKQKLLPQIWSDMFFRIASKTGDYYDLESQIPAEIRQSLPDVQLVYWDYYHHEEKSYQQMLDKHLALSDQVIFAGGIWTWNGLAPNYGKTLLTTQAALQACKTRGVKDLYLTLWGDDGGETPIDSCLPGLYLFAEYQYQGTTDREIIAEKFLLEQKVPLDCYLELDAFDQTPGVAKNNPHASAASKLLLYKDLLLASYEEELNHYDLVSHYQTLLTKLQSAPETPFFDYYKKLAAVLILKAIIVKGLRQAYQSKNYVEIQNICQTLENLIVHLKELYQLREALWFQDNKAYGWEVMDIRFGGLIHRSQQVLKRLTSWLADPTVAIPELADFPLPISQQAGTIGRNLYQGIVSPSKLSDV